MIWSITKAPWTDFRCHIFSVLFSCINKIKMTFFINFKIKSLFTTCSEKYKIQVNIHFTSLVINKTAQSIKQWSNNCHFILEKFPTKREQTMEKFCHLEIAVSQSKRKNIPRLWVYLLYHCESFLCYRIYILIFHSLINILQSGKVSINISNNLMYFMR